MRGNFKDILLSDFFQIDDNVLDFSQDDVDKILKTTINADSSIIFPNYSDVLKSKISFNKLIMHLTIVIQSTYNIHINIT